LITFQQAVSIAKQFLGRDAGVATRDCPLDAVSREDTKWVVTFKYGFILTQRLYTVEIDDKGEIIGYTRKEIT